MMSILKSISLGLFVSIVLMSIAGCEPEGPMERAGKVVDEAVEDAGEAIEDAQEKVEDVVEEKRASNK